jgi:NAD(P)-dependent dehydrogenase (short-subunit alcohol dehydrogenase family)
LGQVGFGGATAYQASKRTVRPLTETAAVQYAPEQIRVNSVHPGLIDTPMTRPLPAELLGHVRAVTPMQRAGTADEVADRIRAEG